jgi:AraC-like DNA-binding protein
MPGLRHSVFQPSEKLRRYVREILFLDSEFHPLQALMPETTPTLMLQRSGSSWLNGHLLPPAIVSGLQTKTRTVEVSARSFSTIIRFTEIGASAFIQGRMDSLSGLSLPLDDVMNHADVDRVLNSLADSPNHKGCMNAVEEFLDNCLRRPLPKEAPVEVGAQMVRRSAGKVSVDKLSRVLRMNHSTLERQFKAKVGATPKVLSRLARLQNVCRLWDVGHSLTEIAYEAGFSDQTHLTHEFKRLTGSAPEQFLTQQSPRNLPTFYK